MNPISKPAAEVLEMARPVLDFFLTSRYAQRQGRPEISDFVAGNPHEMPVPGIADALQKWSVPQSPDWFAYKMSEPESRVPMAQAAREQLGIDFAPSDIFMTTGAFSGLACSIRAVVDSGDEVIFISPRWFFYREMIRMIGANPVRAEASQQDWDLDVDAISAAITPKTRMIIVNSPNNPSGRIYPPRTLETLAAVLDEASERNGRTIYLLSDESYRKIIFGDAEFVSPARFYRNTLVVYTLGKTLLAPGQRMGYVALNPTMRDKEIVGLGLTVSQMTMGWAFPNALLQHAAADLEMLSIDLKHLESKRDIVVDALVASGYDLVSPEGTFYLLPKSPFPDDIEFCDLLAERDVYVLPGRVSDAAGYFRISLTASDEMIERALPVFEWAIEEAHARSR